MIPDGALDAALAEVVRSVGGAPRDGQARMAAAVADALAERRHLLVQAGTGTGKSFGYLIPAALFGITAQQRVLVSTSTLALQRQLITKDVPVVAAASGRLTGRQPSAALVKGRSNYLCRLRLAESAQGTGSDEEALDLPDLSGRLERAVQGLRQWGEETPTGDRDDLPAPVDGRVWRALSVTGRECVGRQRCPFGEQCFAEIARDAAERADIVITNHTLLAIELAGGPGVLPDYDVAVIDEAHDFARRITQAQTESLTVPGLADVLRSAGGMLGAETLQRCSEAAQSYTAQVGGLPTGGDVRLPELPTQLLGALAVLRDSLHAALGEMSGQVDAEPSSRRQRAIAGLEDAHDLAGRIMRIDDSTVRWTSSNPAGITMAPFVVADRISGGLLQRAVVVATSATLTIGGSFRPLAVEWGLPGSGDRHGPGAADEPAGWSHLDVGSPFDYRRQAIIYLPTDLPAGGPGQPSDAVLDRIVALVGAAGGRTLVLASSWRAVDAIAARLGEALPRGPAVLVQDRGSPAAPLVAAFADQADSVLVGTLSLWQGVDVPGASCSCVIIDKIPFPRPDDPVMAARSDAAANRRMSGFAAVSLPHAALLLAQGAGRLIRSPDDRGVIAVLDPRITTRSYGPTLLAGLPDGWRTSDTAAVLAALNRLSEASAAR